MTIEFLVEKIFLLPKGQFTPLSQVTLEGLISAAVNIVLIVASLLFVFNFLIGGLKFIVSGGNKEKMSEAKNQIVSAIVGIIIVFSTFAIVRLVGNFFGVDFTTFEIPTL